MLILHALSHFESLYLSRSTNKLNEAVGQAFSGGIRSPPSANEGTNIARAIVNELDSARFDPLLARSVATNAVAPLDMMLSRVDSMVCYLFPFSINRIEGRPLTFVVVVVEGD